jgi:hypothetical protein
VTDVTAPMHIIRASAAGAAKRVKFVKKIRVIIIKILNKKGLENKNSSRSSGGFC